MCMRLKMDVSKHSELMLPVLWTSQKSDDTDASDSIQTASTDCKFVVYLKIILHS